MKNYNGITDEEAEASVDYLRDTAIAAARAKAERVYVAEYRKVIKAQIMCEHDKLTAVVQERNAYADPRYEAHLKAVRDAVETDERHGFLREAATAKIDAWRTQNASNRGAWKATA